VQKNKTRPATTRGKESGRSRNEEEKEQQEQENFNNKINRKREGRGGIFLKVGDGAEQKQWKNPNVTAYRFAME